MDEDVAELIALICTRAGMMMEDASLLAVTIPRADPDAVKLAIQDLAQWIDACRRLIAAAAALQAVEE